MYKENIDDRNNLHDLVKIISDVTISYIVLNVTYKISLAKDEYQRLVMKLMDYFESMGLTVTCACSGYINCETIKSFEP